MTHRKRKLLAAYLDDEHIATGTFEELEEIIKFKRSSLSNIARLGHKRYYIEDLEKAENYLHRALRGVWHE